MGWTTQHRDKGITNEDFFLAMYDKGTRIHASGTVANVFYAAVESPREPGIVWGLVALTNWAPNDYFNFGYKDMSEDMGPREHRAPLNVLNALTPTEHGSALEWRERVRQYQDQRKAMRGMNEHDQVVMASPLRFTDGSVLDTFIIRRVTVGRGSRTRAVLTDEWGCRYSVPNWQDRIVAVIRDDERIETPLGKVMDENGYVGAVENLLWARGESVQEAVMERYGGKARFGHICGAAREEFRRGDLFELAVSA